MEDPEQFLQSLPLFSTIPDESMEQMLASTEIKTFTPGDTIICEGQPGTFLGIVLEGEVEVATEDHSGQRRAIRKLGKGECFGEMSLVTGDPTSADVVACEGCCAAIIPADVFSNTIAVNPDSVRQLAQLITRKLMVDNIKMHEQIVLSEDRIHVISHELKCPFASIAALAMTILEPYVPMEQKEKLLKRIISRALDAKGMVEEYLVLSAISSDKAEVKPDKVKLYNEIIREILDHQKELIAEKSMTVSVHVPEELEVICDLRYMRIVFNNLLANAANYGIEGSEIYFGYSSPDDGYRRLNVANVGTWIEESNRERIFEKYVTLGKSGTGVGLHTARRIMRDHGGDMWVEPCYLSEGKCIPAVGNAEIADKMVPGNNFILTLPAS